MSTKAKKLRHNLSEIYGGMQQKSGAQASALIRGELFVRDRETTELILREAIYRVVGQLIESVVDRKTFIAFQMQISLYFQSNDNFKRDIFAIFSAL